MDMLVHGKTEVKVEETTEEVVSIIQNPGFKTNHQKLTKLGTI